MSQQGYKTGVIDMTAGEMSSNGDVPTRQKENEESSQVMGLHLRRNLGLPDGYLSAEHSLSDPSSSQLNAVVQCLRTERPEIVLIPWREGRHPDHVAASQLLTKAIFYSGLRKFLPETPLFRPRQVLYYPMRYPFSPRFMVDISEVRMKKRDAILCYQSQIGPSLQHKTLIGSSSSLKAIESRDRYYGTKIGTEAAEAYFCEQHLHVQDPIQHFRQETSAVHFFEKATP